MKNNYKMIIRNQVTKTLKASPINNEGMSVTSTPDCRCMGNIDPKGVARAHGRPSHRC